MFMAVTFLTLLTRIPCGDSIFRTCVPNTQFLLNGRLCYCNSMGRWSEATCQMIGRRQSCQPGQIIWEECSQCICQENGKLLCTNTECSEDGMTKNSTNRDAGAELWCTPFRSYYINCSLCVCPASGKMSEARCATDSSCSLKGPNLSLDLISQNVCIPKVMYLFNCLHCLCSDDGFFVQNKCVETCHKPPESTRRCIPRTFYKVDCNVYRCPDNGVPDNDLRSKTNCNDHSNQISSLIALRNMTNSCVSHKFTKPKCIYCECNSQGVVNESNCLEQECLKIDDFHYDFVKSTCSPGELVPTCMECFCPRSGYTIEKYCTRVCSFQNKLIMLERVLKEKISLIDRNGVKEISVGTETCEPNSVFLDQGRYCLCPDNGNADFKLCTSVIDNTGPKKTQRVAVAKANLIDYNITCEPNTFVEFGCNTCYCTKDGKIDQKWCTFDDCEAKKVIQEAHKDRVVSAVPAESSATCVPGSISKVNCNFCICSVTGLIKDRACTNNTCTGQSKAVGNEFTCEPSAYFTVDCNICFCSTDGVKNVDKCTKNQCETNFLRTDSCSPGELFSDECNICVCPLNGEKKDKACTNRTCFESDTPWKMIFKLSQNLLGNQVVEDTTRNLELCFPGEEFQSGCKLCVCPEMGLREYASCTPMLCDKEKPVSTSLAPGEIRDDYSEEQNEDDMANGDDFENLTGDLGGTDRIVYSLINETRRENCIIFNISDSSERATCTPGSQYIIRCRLCVCPYLGNINEFCRPLPDSQYCEQAYPTINFVPMGRRNNDNSTSRNSTLSKPKSEILFNYPHNHTKYMCDEPGKISDDCYICECEKDKVLIEEHCFKSDAEACANANPTFIAKTTFNKNIKMLNSWEEVGERRRWCIHDEPCSNSCRTYHEYYII